MSQQQLARAERQEKALSLQNVVDMTGFEPAQIALISRTVAVGAPLVELAVFLHACRELHLDPLLRQAYWIRRGDPPKGTLQVGIDGFRAIADRTGVYAGSEPPAFRGSLQLATSRGGVVTVPERAQVIVWKIVAGHKAAFTGEAWWSEFYPGDGPVGAMWRKMPRHMLAKVAEAQALRKAFPALLGPVDMADEIEGDLPLVGVPQVEIEQEQEKPVKRQVTAEDYDRIIGASFEPAPAPDPDQEAVIREQARTEVGQAEQPTPPAQQDGDDPRSKLWAQNRDLSNEAAAQGIKVPTLNARATAEALQAANKHLEDELNRVVGT